MSNSIVRLALVASVAWTVAAGEVPDQPRVDRAERQVVVDGMSRSASSHSNLMPRSTGRAPARCVSRTSGRRPPAASSSHRAAVRRSCQTIAVPYGSPVERFQATTVSRWLVMPIAATVSPAPTRSTTSASVGRHRCPDLVGVVLDPAGLREVLGELPVATAIAVAARRRRPPGCARRWCRRRWRSHTRPVGASRSARASCRRLRSLRRPGRWCARVGAGRGRRVASVAACHRRGAGDGPALRRAASRHRLSLVAELGEHRAERRRRRTTPSSESDDRLPSCRRP